MVKWNSLIIRIINVLCKVGINVILPTRAVAEYIVSGYGKPPVEVEWEVTDKSGKVWETYDRNSYEKGSDTNGRRLLR